MRTSGNKSIYQGFTIVEILVVITIIMMFALVGYPAFNNLIDQARITAVVRSAASKMQLARQEAIKMNAQVVVQPDFDLNELFVFVNVDGDPGFEFNPDPNAPLKTVDYELAHLQLPTDYGFSFRSPADNGPKGKTVIEGLTVTSAPVNAVVFVPHGSVMDTGSIRIADDRSNFFEIRIEPRATARVEVLKYHPDPPWGDPAGFYQRGQHEETGDPMWVWF